MERTGRRGSLGNREVPEERRPQQPQPQPQPQRRRQSEPTGGDRFEGRPEGARRARQEELPARRERDRDASPRRAQTDDERPAPNLRRALEADFDLRAGVEEQQPARRVRGRQDDGPDPDRMVEDRPLRGEPGPLFQELEQRRARNVAPQGWGEAGTRVLGQGVVPTAMAATGALPLVTSATVVGPLAALTPMTGGLALLGAAGGVAAYYGAQRAADWYWNRGPEPTISVQHAQAIQDNRALLQNWRNGEPNALENLRNGLRVLGIDIRADRQAGVGWRLQADLNPQRAEIAGIDPQQVATLIEELNAAVRQ